MDSNSILRTSWNGPRVMVERITSTTPVRRIRRRQKGRRMLFHRQKEHRKKWQSLPNDVDLVSTLENVQDDTIVEQRFFQGFHNLTANARYHRGFEDSEYLESFRRSVLAQAAIEETFMQVPDSPVTCVSIASSSAAVNLQHSLKIEPWVKMPLRCLSLFDGIGTGFHVLHDKLEIDVEVYFSSEIDIDAIAVQRLNYCGRITALGCVKKLTSEVLDSLGRIDLLIGGSPCNELSRVNPKRKGLFDESSSGSLFFEYVSVRNFLQEKAERMGTKFLWLFENTSHLDRDTKVAMTEHLRCQPVVICSSVNHLPVRRKRLFYGNIPWLGSHSYGKKSSAPLPLQSLLKPYRTACVPIMRTVTTKSSCQQQGHLKGLPVVENGLHTPLRILELELLFGFPEHFTDTGHLSLSRRMKLLGRSWCVPVVVDILRPLKEMYKLAV